MKPLKKLERFMHPKATTMKTTLKRDWEIEDKASAIETVENLKENGPYTLDWNMKLEKSW